jgi:hypothetical protein
MLVNGDKLVVTKKVANFLNEGDIVVVVDVSENGMISFAFGENFIHKGLMNMSECEEHFEKFEYEFKAPSISEEDIDEIVESSDIEIQTVFGKCTIVSCRLPNGFVIVESSACVSPENYNEDIGIDICMEKIKNKIWELEGYRLQDELYRENFEDDDEYEFNDFEGFEFEEEDFEDDEDEECDCDNCRGCSSSPYCF